MVIAIAAIAAITADAAAAPAARAGESVTIVESPAGTANAAADSLLGDITPVLARSYAGRDTAVLLARVRERLQWGERDGRLLEAEAIILWDRGDAAGAVAALKQIAAPRPEASLLLADALAWQGDKYAAADCILRAARALPAGHSETEALYRRYLAARPDDGTAELELAALSEARFDFGSAMESYWKRRDLLMADTASAARAADLLAVHGRLAQAAAIADTQLAARPGDPAWTGRLAAIRAAMGDPTGAASLWAGLWRNNPSDTGSPAFLEKALAALEAGGPSAGAALKELLDEALRHFPLEPGVSGAPGNHGTPGIDGKIGESRNPRAIALRLRYARALLAEGNRKSAYAMLDEALRADPGNPACLALLPEAIEGDSLIRVHAAFLAERSPRQPEWARLAVLAARASSLTGNRPEACAAWNRAASADAAALAGRRDAFLDLAACGDPVSTARALALGDERLSLVFDREIILTLLPLVLEAGDYAKASGYAARLAAESPADAVAALEAAKALLAADRIDEARPVLAGAADGGHSPEASLLLGRLLMAEGAWADAAQRFDAARDSLPLAGRLAAECLERLGDFAGAGAAYESHFHAAGDRESLHAAARLRRLAGDAGGELAALGVLAENGWADEPERLRLGLMRFSRGDSRGAMAVLAGLFRDRAALPEGAEWREAALRAGLQSAREGSLDLAIHALGLGLAASAGQSVRDDGYVPSHLAEAWLRLGECLAEKGKWREAHAAYASALEADPASAEAAIEMLHAAKRFGGTGEIEAACAAVYRLDSLNAEANEFIAAGHQAARRYRQAAAHYRRVADAHPADAQAWENLGNALAMASELEAAGAALQNALDLGAHSDEVYINRARAYRAAGDKEMAASILRFLLGRNPRNFLAVLWSARFAEEDGFASTASDLYRKSSRLKAPATAWPELARAGSPPPDPAGTDLESPRRTR